MPLPAFLRRTKESNPLGAAVREPQSTEAMKRQAQQRLIGTVILVLAAVILFPLVFDTKPRDMAADVPIRMTRPDGSESVSAAAGVVAQPLTAAASDDQAQAPAAAELASPDRDKKLATSSGKASAAQAMALDEGEQAVDEPAPPASAPPATASARHEIAAGAVAAGTAMIAAKLHHDKAPAANTSAASAAPNAASAPQHETPTSQAQAAKRAQVKREEAKQAEAKRALAILNGAALPVAAGASASHASPAKRYLVQAGAYAENARAHEVRQKIEKLGLASVAQGVDTPAGHRVRVRLGPYASAQEAAHVVARLKQAGLSATVVPL